MSFKTRFSCSMIIIFAMIYGLAGCEGSDGANGKDVDPAVVEDLLSQIDAMADAQNVRPESCVICHADDGSIALSGAGHQADYDQYYQDQVLRVTNLSYANVAGNDEVTFKMTKKNEVTGAEEPFNCLDATTNDPDLPSDALNINFAEYNPATREYSDGAASTFWRPIKGTLTYDSFTDTCKSVKAESVLGDLNLRNGHIAVYGRDETLKSNSAKHISNPKFPFATILKLGTNDYVSNANSSGCENCHTQPFLKHAYIYGEVSNATGADNIGNDFYVCKTCHLDGRNGGHEDWQILADDPVRHAEILAGDDLTADEEEKYAYKTRLMNDVHMAHNMEFGFPQSMKNCNTCHEDKLGNILTDANYTAETCISCHAIDNLVDKMQAFGSGIHDPYVDVDADNAATLKATTCNSCHKPVIDGGIGPVFSAIHNGYDAEIYADAAGTKYSEAFVVTVETASFDALTNMLSIGFKAVESPDIAGLAVTDIVPTVLVGPYGYDTKHYIVPPHGRDFDDNGDGIVGQRNVDQRNLEYTVGAVHPRFTTVSAAGGDWVVSADMSPWADMIADGTIKRVELGVMPVLDDANGDEVAMNAPSRTFDLGANDFDDAYFPDVVDVMGGCNGCHDALATTFHSGKRGGNIKICKMCHVPSSAGSHLEMQSRSIDSYVHAIHSFQVFDIGDIDFTDPVEAAEHAHHMKAEFPKFGITNCEACHNPGTYGVPDQSKSLPSLHAGNDVVATGRNIGTVPRYVMGPAARACGACHRAQMLNEDDAGKLASFNEHTRIFGYLVEDGDDIWETIVENIMSMFN